MTTCTKTRRSAAGRKKSRGRAVDGANPPPLPQLTPGRVDTAETEADGRKRVRRDALTAYMDGVGAISGLLTAKDEQAMAARIQKGLAASRRELKTALPKAEAFRDWKPSRASAKTPEKIVRAQALLAKFNPDKLRGADLAKHIDRSSIGDLGLPMLAWCDKEASRTAERFIHANLRLVIQLAKRFAFHGYMPLEDLIQEGNAGLVTAVLRFDPKRGFRFSTYASWWIRHALGRSMADKSRLIRLPVHMIDLSQKVTRARKELVARLGRMPSEDELAEATGCTKKKLALLRGGLYDPCSIDEPIDEESGDRTLGDVLSVEAPEPSEWATLHPEKETRILREAIEELPPIMQSVLRLRFGFDDEGERTLREIGETYRLSRERIRQLQEDGLKRLRLRLAKSYAAAI